MKIICPQCGSEHVVMESDFLLRCPYCDSRIMVETPAGTPAMVRTAVTEESVRRLFPPGMVVSMVLRFFPYLETGEGSSRSRIPCFSQPWQELDSYTPPDGDRLVFDESMAAPGDIMPLDRDLLESTGGRLVLHPFFVVMLRLQGYSEGMLVDGVSGRLLGEVPLKEDGRTDDLSLEKLFLTVLALGMLVSVPAYVLGSTLDLSEIPRFWFSMATVLFMGAVLFLKWKSGR
ncbi:MAG: hypothetical protein AVO35_03115 [Candidatus Aegiribacteria sp. MLS_C]|nr:MAG: hypothetical protein AVO35_03115 [Candidatus Aegiribacteria sp. MLS_C]